MRKIAVLNQKGGVGKTTTAVNLSAALARQGQRVCLADLDPQSHASLHLSASLRPSARPDWSMYHVLVDEAMLGDIRQLAGHNLWVCPAHIDLAGIELELVGVAGREVRFRDKLLADGQPFDYFVVDCPPSLGILTLNALCACDEVLIPLQPHFLALHGLSKLLETMELVAQRINSRLRLTGVLMCLYDSGTKLASEVHRDICEFLEQSRGQSRPWSQARVFATRIRRNVRLAEAPSFGQSIFDYAPGSPGAQDYEALAGEFVAYALPPMELSPDEFRQTMAALSLPVV
jgi:chromosome partitioning protein